MHLKTSKLLKYKEYSNIPINHTLNNTYNSACLKIIRCSLIMLIFKFPLSYFSTTSLKCS